MCCIDCVFIFQDSRDGRSGEMGQRETGASHGWRCKKGGKGNEEEDRWKLEGGRMTQKEEGGRRTQEGGRRKKEGRRGKEERGQKKEDRGRRESVEKRCAWHPPNLQVERRHPALGVSAQHRG